MEIDRKLDHIQLANSSQIKASAKDSRFYYEPMFFGNTIDFPKNEIGFFGKKLAHPFWISSMTGGVAKGKVINHNLAKLCHRFGLGMGLGSCRSILLSESRFSDFDVREILGDDLPLFANIGMAQLEELILNKKLNLLLNLVSKLKADGLIVHINPFQEFLQPEGDRYRMSPLEAISILKSETNLKLIIKEVGQGMGPLSLKSLIDLKVDGIELAGLGGTNFSKLEILRNQFVEDSSAFEIPKIGHTALEMISFLNSIYQKNLTTKIIISGGISHMQDAHFLLSQSKFESVIGFAHKVLNKAEDYQVLEEYFLSELQIYYLIKNLTKVVKE